LRQNDDFTIFLLSFGYSEDIKATPVTPVSTEEQEEEPQPLVASDPLEMNQNETDQTINVEGNPKPKFLQQLFQKLRLAVRP